MKQLPVCLLSIWVEIGPDRIRFWKFVNVYWPFRYYLTLEKGVALLLKKKHTKNNLKSLYPRMFYIKFGWHWPSGITIRTYAYMCQTTTSHVHLWVRIKRTHRSMQTYQPKYKEHTSKNTASPTEPTCIIIFFFLCQVR